MDLATGAMKTLLPKLAELVVGEYNLQKGVKGKIEKLEKEMTSMTAALHKVAEVPQDQLDEQVKIWASDVRELSYDIEDQVDTFMLPGKPSSLEGIFVRASDLIKKAKTNHKIHNAIEDIMDQVKEVAERRDKYKVDSVAANPNIVAVDPRLEALYRKATELVGIGQPKNELAKRLCLEQDYSSPSRQQSNMISIVGFGGLGKTTLAKSLFQDHKSKFDCSIFVSVSLKPDIMMIFKNILLQLDENKYSHLDEGWEMNQLIDKIKEFLKNRRCLCVIDDLWKELAWDTIKLAFQDGHPGSKIIITTRNKSVAEHVGGGVYELKPLSDDDSRELLTKRIFDTNDECPPSLREITGKILKKCGGVPLAIITIASLLASKLTVEWEEVNKSIGSGLENTLDVDKMRKILSLSYNDLPIHLKTCLLSLSKYPEDHLIRKDVVVWSWMAEGFIKQEKETQGRPAGKSLQEIGESYFNDLINRSLIQPEESPDPRKGPPIDRDGQVHCFRVHDMVLELINQLSAEGGFVTTTMTMQMRKIRRLSLNSNSIKIESYAASSKASSREQLSKVRSLDVFGKLKWIPHLSSFPVLRVLQVDDCSGLDSNHLNDLGNLRLLRFLRLHDLGIDELPESIGKLESLETLDIRRVWVRRPMVLPVSLAKLRKLVRLFAGAVKLPDGLTLENMTSLQELVGIWVTLHAVTEVGKLGQLKVLGLCLHSNESNSDLNELIVMCLQSCPSLHVFILGTHGRHWCPLDLMAQLPYDLRTFTSSWCFFKEGFPKWNKAQLSYLTVLNLGLVGVCVLPEHLEQLAELPSLGFLQIYFFEVPDEQEKLSIASGFPCLTYLEFGCPVLFLEFQQGAMPKLQKLHLALNPILDNEHFLTSTSYSGLENLPSLRHVSIHLLHHPRGNDYREEEKAIRKAVNDHPNHPSLDLSYSYRPGAVACNLPDVTSLQITGLHAFP